ncbi:UbiA family prenyltransferase [bacterium]|nr:UbiA family prenyltransferase [bacterium]
MCQDAERTQKPQLQKLVCPPRQAGLVDAFESLFGVAVREREVLGQWRLVPGDVEFATQNFDVLPVVEILPAPECRQTFQNGERQQAGEKPARPAGTPRCRPRIGSGYRNWTGCVHFSICQSVTIVIHDCRPIARPADTDSQLDRSERIGPHFSLRTQGQAGSSSDDLNGRTRRWTLPGPGISACSVGISRLSERSRSNSARQTEPVSAVLSHHETVSQNRVVRSNRSGRVPEVLFVDLDGTLHASDLFAESLVLACSRSWHNMGRVLLAALRGRAVLKQTTAALVTPDLRRLPWRSEMLALINELRAAGCRIVLATATAESWARRVAAHLDVFDDVLASDGSSNLKGRAKLAAIRDYCQRHGFDEFAYAGDSRADLPVWEAASQAYVVAARPTVEDRITASHDNVQVIVPSPNSWRGLLKTMRPMQWMKNSLLFVPLLLSHNLANLSGIGAVLVAFVAMSLCASAIYILNDLLDLSADRRHPIKRFRPLASGTLPLSSAVMWFGVLMVGGFSLAFGALPLGFGGLLVAYVVLTLFYTLWLKREAVADVIVLSGLYTLRVFAGGVAAGIVVSEWLMTLSVFLFTSLAFAKRHAELDRLQREGNFRARGRGYVVSDLPMIRTLGPCSGYLAILVFAFYSRSEQSQTLYANTWALWLICPLALFWISRMWLIAMRGHLQEDPVVFALKDRVSLLVGAVAGILLAIATIPLTVGVQ